MKHTNTIVTSFQLFSMTKPLVSWCGPDKGWGCHPHQETGKNRRRVGSHLIIAYSGDCVSCWCQIQAKWTRFRGRLHKPDIRSNLLSNWLSIQNWLVGFRLAIKYYGNYRSRVNLEEDDIRICKKNPLQPLKQSLTTLTTPVLLVVCI